MANTSILAAFERMWQHVVAVISNKADVAHGHAIADVTDLQTTLDDKQKKSYIIPIVNDGDDNYSIDSSFNFSWEELVAAINDNKIVICREGDVNDYHTDFQLSDAWVSDGNMYFTNSTHHRVAVIELFSNGTLDYFVQYLHNFAPASHNHAASNITSGTLSSDRLPTVPITKGGTGATTAAAALTNLGAVPTSRTVNGYALSSDITLSASDVSARANTWMPTATDVGAVPTSRTVNGKALTSNISLVASDVGAVPTSRTINGKALSSNITLSASDVGLGSVNNTSDVDKPISNAQATKFASMQTEIDTAELNLANHMTNSNNPHGVTAAQVGAVPTYQVRAYLSATGWYRVGTLNYDSNIEHSAAARIIMGNKYNNTMNSTIMVDVVTGRKKSSAVKVAVSDTPRAFTQIRLAYITAAEYYVEVYYEPSVNNYCAVTVEPLMGSFTPLSGLTASDGTGTVTTTLSLV